MAPASGMTEIRRLETPASFCVERSASGGPTRFVGYAAVFNSRALITHDFQEQIAPGAFAESIKRNDIRALYAHDRDQVLGRRSAGTLHLGEDSRGVHIRIDVPNTTLGRDLTELISRGDISGCSFGCFVESEDWDPDYAPPLRTLKRVNCYEFSIVSWPAYEATTIDVEGQPGERSALKRLQRKAEMEMRLRGIA